MVRDEPLCLAVSILELTVVLYVYQVSDVALPMGGGSLLVEITLMPPLWSFKIRFSTFVMSSMCILKSPVIIRLLYLGIRAVSSYVISFRNMLLVALS